MIIILIFFLSGHAPVLPSINDRDHRDALCMRHSVFDVHCPSGQFEIGRFVELVLLGSGCEHGKNTRAVRVK